MLSVCNTWRGTWTWRSTCWSVRTGTGTWGGIDSIDGISSDNLLINIRSIIDDIIDLDGRTSLTRKADIKLVVISAVNDLTIAAVDLRNGITLITLKNLLNTKVEAAGDLSIACDFSDINLDISAVNKSNFLSYSILSTVNLILIGGKIMSLRRAFIINCEIGDDLDIGRACKDNITRIVDTKLSNFSWNTIDSWELCLIDFFYKEYDFVN